MDWNNVTLGDLLDGLKEVEWKPPRPLNEFLLAPNAFMLPKSGAKWNSRIKNNLYYYRSNYVLMFMLSFTVCFLRNPVALVSIIIVMGGLFCLNDPVATGTNDLLLRIMKRFHSRTAMRLRALSNTLSDGNLGVKRRGNQRLYILWLPRGTAVLLIVMFGFLLMWRSAAVVTLAWVMLLGLGLPLLHATFRSPNLKSRLATAKDEFRAVWRGYQAGLQNDYTQ
ncbi:hypothetical protein CEUSTIGMA_g3463.t1 [Chlamydomonas eustigma]|uniref:PRA1 family protein n=1 Tax=Chlamydomonas eustigma TaxID=1157962 RepID=A0A250WZT6_9CHLO|nr:hypothetical protein CEUSTIGMA_g3463.t1 [Chlamydomonas eustigma]|eukprot:GAX76020.1 hypothetical protein CEUSTIGMA_g3463.t1 [Chlamydomonas eustigma]